MRDMMYLSSFASEDNAIECINRLMYSYNVPAVMREDGGKWSLYFPGDKLSPVAAIADAFVLGFVSAKEPEKMR